MLHEITEVDDRDTWTLLDAWLDGRFDGDDDAPETCCFEVTLEGPLAELVKVGSREEKKPAGILAEEALREQFGVHD